LFPPEKGLSTSLKREHAIRKIKEYNAFYEYRYLAKSAVDAEKDAGSTLHFDFRLRPLRALRENLFPSEKGLTTSLKSKHAIRKLKEYNAFFEYSYLAKSAVDAEIVLFLNDNCLSVS